MAQTREPTPGGGATAADLSHALRRIDFPCGKGDLVEHARRHEAPPAVIGILERLEERQYTSMADVEHEFHRVKREIG